MPVHSEEFEEIQSDHEKAMAEMAEQYKGKLIVEYQKYDNLEEMYNSIKRNYDQKMIEVEKSTMVSTHDGHYQFYLLNFKS